MREPVFKWESKGVEEWTPYSRAPISALRHLAAGQYNFCADSPDPGLRDFEFRKQWAAILLKERGQ